MVPMPPPIMVPQPFSSLSTVVIPSPSSVPSPNIPSISNPTYVGAAIVDPPLHKRPMIEHYAKG